MHITLSGPYETLYTFAVDMWSFGCLCLNICIGKTAALKQREEASLLLSRTHPCGRELWEKTTKVCFQTCSLYLLLLFDMLLYCSACSFLVIILYLTKLCIADKRIKKHKAIC